MTAGFGNLTEKERADRRVRKRAAKTFQPGKFDDLRSKIQRSDAKVLRVVRERAKRKYIGSDAARRSKLPVRMSKELTLGAHPAPLEDFVRILHLMGRVVI